MLNNPAVETTLCDLNTINVSLTVIVFCNSFLIFVSYILCFSSGVSEGVLYCWAFMSTYVFHFSVGLYAALSTYVFHFSAFQWV